jgi:hypothetical protein
MSPQMFPFGRQHKTKKPQEQNSCGQNYFWAPLFLRHSDALQILAEPFIFLVKFLRQP